MPFAPSFLILRHPVLGSAFQVGFQGQEITVQQFAEAVTARITHHLLPRHAVRIDFCGLKPGHVIYALGEAIPMVLKVV